MTEGDDPWANHIRGLVPSTPLEEGRDPLSLMSSTSPPMHSTPKAKINETSNGHIINKQKDDLETLEVKWGLGKAAANGSIVASSSGNGVNGNGNTSALVADGSSLKPLETTHGHEDNEGDAEDDDDDDEAFVYPNGDPPAISGSGAKSRLHLDDTADAAELPSKDNSFYHDQGAKFPDPSTSTSATKGLPRSFNRDQEVISGRASEAIDYYKLSGLCSRGSLSSLQSFFEVTTASPPAGSGVSAFALANEPNPASGLVPIHFAAREGRVDILKWLITEKGAIVEMEDKEGETALHKAALAGRLPALSLLLSSGADANAKDGDGWTALHNACSRGYLDIVKILVESAGAHIDVKGGRGSWTPLMNASSHGHLPIVRYLTNRQQADPFVRNAAGETAYDVAAATFEIYICEILERYENDRWSALQLSSQAASESASTSQSLSTTSPYNPLALHMTIPVILYENQRLDTRLSTLALRGGKPRWSGTQAGRPDKTDRRAPSTMPPGPLSLSRSRNVPMRREDVKLPTRDEPYKMRLANRSTQIAAAKRARGEVVHDEYGTTPTPDSVMSRSRKEAGPSNQPIENSHFWQSEWQQDLTSPQVDAEEGWQYGQSFDTPEERWLAAPPAPLTRLLEGRGLGQNMQRAVTGAMLGSSDAVTNGDVEAISTGWVRRRRWVRVMRRRLDIDFEDDLGEEKVSSAIANAQQPLGKSGLLTSCSVFEAQQMARSDAEKLGSQADYIARSRAMAGNALHPDSQSAEQLKTYITRLELAVSELRNNAFNDNDTDRQARAEELLKGYTLQLRVLRQEVGLEADSEDEDDGDEDAEFIYPNSYKDDGQSVITRIGTPSVTPSGIVPPHQRSAPNEVGLSLGATRSVDLANAADFRVPTNEMPSRPSLITRPSLQEQVLLPTWENDGDVGSCRGCNRKFTFFLRKHHCRRCGRIHCDACSSHRAHLLPDELVIDPGIPEMIITEASGPTRICDTCDAERRLPTSIRNIHGMDALSHAVDQVGLQRDDSNVSDVSSRASELNECPVCNVVLANVGDGAMQEEHIRLCLDNGGGGSVQGGRYLIYKLAEGPIVGKECQICLEDLCVGMTIARLPCLCYYHRHCIDSWFSRGRECPVHARSW